MAAPDNPIDPLPADDVFLLLCKLAAPLDIVRFCQTCRRLAGFLKGARASRIYSDLPARLLAKQDMRLGLEMRWERLGGTLADFDDALVGAVAVATIASYGLVEWILAKAPSREAASEAFIAACEGGQLGIAQLIWRYASQGMDPLDQQEHFLAALEVASGVSCHAHIARWAMLRLRVLEEARLYHERV